MAMWILRSRRLCWHGIMTVSSRPWAQGPANFFMIGNFMKHLQGHDLTQKSDEKSSKSDPNHEHHNNPPWNQQNPNQNHKNPTPKHQNHRNHAPSHKNPFQTFSKSSEKSAILFFIIISMTRQKMAITQTTSVSEPANLLLWWQIATRIDWTWWQWRHTTWNYEHF